MTEPRALTSSELHSLNEGIVTVTVADAASARLAWLEHAGKRLQFAEAQIECLTRERNAAFTMSRCECASDEACANIVKVMRERDEARQEAQSLRDCVEAIGAAQKQMNAELTALRGRRIE